MQFDMGYALIMTMGDVRLLPLLKFSFTLKKKKVFQKQQVEKTQGSNNCSPCTEQYILFSYSLLSITGCQL